MLSDVSASFDHPARRFDLVLVGSGIACTLTLTALLERLESASTRRDGPPLEIGVIERDEQFWRGFPYGRRSARNSLIITTLGEFVPDAEHDDFIAWLKASRASWEQRIREANPGVTDFWLAQNRDAMDAGEWDEVYVPRILYGDFAEEKLRSAMDRAGQEGRAQVTTMTGEAIAMRPGERGGYDVAIRTANGPVNWSCRLAVLTVGSPPVRSILEPGFEPGFAYVPNAYEPSLPGNLQSMRDLMLGRAPADRNLLIVGTNATCLELTYMLARDTALRNMLHKVVTLSLGGSFPRRMTRNRFRPERFPRLEALHEAAEVTPDAVIEAAEADVADLDQAGVPDVGDTLHHLSGQLVKAMERLSQVQQREFHHRHGMRFTRLIRRAGAEYRDAAQSLIDAGILDPHRGRFVALDNASRPGFARLRYATEAGGLETHPLAFAAVINTSGFEDLTPSSSSPLLADLVRTGLARANETGRGLALNEALEAAPGLFVNGPLVGGIFNATARFWHVENVRRIHTIAQMLGPTLQRALSRQELVAAI